MSYVRNRGWPELEHDCKQQLIHPVDTCLFGPEQGLIQSYADAVKTAGAPVEQLNASQAGKRFPMFDFSGLNALADGSGGLIDARNTLSALHHQAKQQGVHLFENTKVDDIEIDQSPIKVFASETNYQTDSLIICNGAWTSRLVPQLADTLTVVRQTVGYFDIDKPCDTKHFPVWAYLGMDENDIYYGLPEYNQPGIKAAKHLTEADAINPDHPSQSNEHDLQAVLALLNQRLTVPIKSVLSYEPCLYTLTPTHNFIIDRHPENSQVVIAAGFSGHGFKFAPVTGHKLAALITGQINPLSEFDATWDKFKISSVFNQSD